MDTVKLLAVVEIPRDIRIRCQSSECTHPVFRHIHLVHINNALRIYGAGCFKKQFDGQPAASSTPKFTSPNGRHLTYEEQQLLAENATLLIQKFESECQTESDKQTAMYSSNPPAAQAINFSSQAATFENHVCQHISVIHAMQMIRTRYGVDPTLPGWSGLVLTEMEKYNRKLT